jgi:hypothetical protein
MGSLHIVSGVGATSTDGLDVIQRSHPRMVVAKKRINRLEAKLTDVVVPLEDLSIEESFYCGPTESSTTAVMISTTLLRMVCGPLSTTSIFPGLFRVLGTPLSATRPIALPSLLRIIRPILSRLLPQLLTMSNTVCGPLFFSVGHYSSS